MPGMTDSALETTAPSDTDSVPAPAPVDTATAPSVDDSTADKSDVEVLFIPDAEPELTDEQKALKAYLDAEKAWQTRFDPDWAHERVDFHGDYLAARKPTAAALTAVSLGTGKYIADQTRADFVGKFIELHLAPESYGQFLTRMMNPNEKDYGDNAFGDLVKALSEETADELVASADKS